jgi:hypothetical protein
MTGAKACAVSAQRLAKRSTAHATGGRKDTRKEKQGNGQAGADLAAAERSK